MNPLPVSFRQAAIHWMCPVKLRITPWNCSVKGVKDIPRPVSIDHIEQRNRAVADRFSPLLIVFGQHHSERLVNPRKIKDTGDLSGNQVILKDGTGLIVAQLYSSASGQFNGQTSTGSPISLYR